MTPFLSNKLLLHYNVLLPAQTVGTSILAGGDENAYIGYEGKVAATCRICHVRLHDRDLYPIPCRCVTEILIDILTLSDSI